MSLSQYQRRATDLVSQYRFARRQVVEERQALDRAKALVSNVEQAQQILQHLGQGVQQQAHACIAGVVSKCLEAVFEEPYVFKIEFERKRGRTEARLVFLRDEHEIDPLEGSGGGVIDVAAFALRLACIMLGKPPVRRIVIADEPFRFVSSEYRPRIRAMLEMLAKEMKVQFIIVSHIEELQTGAVIEVS